MSEGSVTMTNEKKDDLILLAHGDGGLLTHQLLQDYFLRYFNNDLLDQMTDAAVFQADSGQMAISTDAFVVDPIFFPGGDIGKLAVCGTVNDLAVSGAQPLYLTASFIIEEGFSLGSMEKIIASIAETCKDAGVRIIAGDTKVVGRGQADKIFISTTGVGYLLPGVNLGYQCLGPGDKVLVNGCLGNHGLSILLQRESLGLESQVVSDCAPLNSMIKKILSRFPGVKFMRDLTRGGLATNAKETALSAKVDFWFNETALPVEAGVRGITNLLGLDPLYLANEGKFMVVVAATEADALLSYLQEELSAGESAIIGEIQAGEGNVFLKTALGGTRRLNMMAGAPLPRIC
ncbi:MAG: Hydrogenase isoenzymes formation protein HypE [Pelotomaculum sp. PtaB.Bin104]|nr:MAG: Hydrogenase isoenzymes formation protein HypE [Pelotomaculum sp. PtaB.Bin104]